MPNPLVLTPTPEGSGRTTVGSYLRSWLESAGRRSLKASTWRTYDVALAYFGDQPGRYAGEADYYIARKGIKYSLLHDFARGE